MNPLSTHLLSLASGIAILLLALGCGTTDVSGESAADSPYLVWDMGPPTEESWFPIGVWLQDPRNAERYLNAGINVYVGLWQGPTEAQLDALGRVGMKVICHQNDVGLARADDPTIIAWMHGDEPDNAQPREEGGYGPPIPPEEIVADYNRLRQADPSRPVLLNLGQGVAWDEWYGRGVRTNHPEDYPRYIEGADIVSFDIYPAVHDHPDVAGRLEYVARGVKRLVEWSDPDQVVWNVIEASRISNPSTKPTPEQIRSEVWMSLISGSKGIVYFVHQFEPNFIEASLLSDPVLLEAVTNVNRQIHELAPVLNAPSIDGAVSVEQDDPNGVVEMLVKAHEDDLYVFMVNLSPAPTSASVRLHDADEYSSVEVLGEDRQMVLEEGTFDDTFAGYGVHLYLLP